MKRFLLLAIALVALVALVGFAADYPKIGLILATGGLGDKSFNDQSFKGATDACTKIAAQYGVTVDDVLDYVEPTAIAEYAGYQLQFADAGIYDLIVCIGFDQAEALEVTAAEYPDQKFAIVDMVVVADNVASLVTNDWESAFLCGVVAGMMTKTGTVGFEGGKDEPLIQRFLAGYTQGAQWANPSVTVIHRFVGDWANPTLGAEIAREMYNAGADYIYGAAGKSHLGVFTAAEENPAWFALGTDVDQAGTVPESADVIVASGLKRVDLEVETNIESLLDGTWAAGIYSYGMVSDFHVGTGVAVGTVNVNNYVTASVSTVPVPCEVVMKCVEAANGILDGTIVITGLVF
jgi:basic membrane protein A